MTGDLLGTFAAEPDPGFGIRNVAWHPSGMFLAIAGWDDKVCTSSRSAGVATNQIIRHSQVHILEHLTWSRVATLELGSRIPPGVVCLNELLSAILRLNSANRQCGGSRLIGSRQRRGVDFCHVKADYSFLSNVT